MTALNPEAKQPETDTQIKSDKDLSQQNVEPNIPQKKADTLEQNTQELKESQSQEDPNWKAFRDARKKTGQIRKQLNDEQLKKNKRLKLLKRRWRLLSRLNLLPHLKRINNTTE